MSRVLTKAIESAELVASEAYESSLQYKAGGGVIDLAPSGMVGGIASWQEQASYKTRYDLNRGWVYAAINVLASEGAGQPLAVVKLKGSVAREDEEKRRMRRKDFHAKQLAFSKFTKSMKSKAASTESEILEDHPLIDLLDQPNSFQSKWQFVYSFIANLGLTGWSYVVAGEHKGKLELYSLPTTWVKPVHEPRPFTKFKIKNPKAATAEPVTLERHQVGFAHLPNPSDPLSALAPAAAQMMAIRIDDHMQTSQETFFRNGIFPSGIITIGKVPFMNTEGRPVLTSTQRRQVIGAVRKLQGGVTNYGQPMIVDGLIESFERLSATQTEMGWEKSEEKIKTRILSAYAVHPYILGENVRVGGYAQVANIEKRFYKRVNTYLDMLGILLTNLLGGVEGKEKLLVGFEEVEVSDPQLREKQLESMRKQGDISRNERRAEAGFSPEEEEKAERSQLLESVGGMTGAVSILTAVGQGAIPREGPKPSEPPVAPPKLEEENEEEEEPEEGEIEEAVEELGNAVRSLERMTKPVDLADEIMGSVGCRH
jgi:phage portal protein BeeE